MTPVGLRIHHSCPPELLGLPALRMTFSAVVSQLGTMLLPTCVVPSNMLR